MIKVTGMYPYTEGGHSDHAYYRDRHMPMVKARLGSACAYYTVEKGFNELDSLISLGILNRVKHPAWRVSLACPAPHVRSMNGVTIAAQALLEEAAEADAVIVGSGMHARAVVQDAALMARLKRDPARQLIGAQCSGTLVLAKLGLLGSTPACTDVATRPWVQEAGGAVVNQPFAAKGNVATAGGCLASQYLAAWVIARLVSMDAAREARDYVAPVGEKDEYVERMVRNVGAHAHANL